MKKEIIELNLPFPPSVNQIWRSYKGRTVLSKKAREFRQQVSMIASNIPCIKKGGVRVDINIHPPDRRKRDLDNLLKSLLDSLNGKAYGDDSQVDEIHIYRKEKVKGGMADIRIQNILDKE
jgi:crossover junction endodeoxyribonuclease RusA